MLRMMRNDELHSVTLIVSSTDPHGGGGDLQTTASPLLLRKHSRLPKNLADIFKYELRFNSNGNV